MTRNSALAVAGVFVLTILAGISLAKADDPPTGIVAWWRAEGNAQDSIGGNHGTLVGGTTFSNGVDGLSFVFDGISGYVDVTNSGSLDFGTNDFTICAWVFFASSGGGLSTDQDILQKNVGVYPNHRGYFLEYVSGEPQPVLRFMVHDTDANKNDLMLSAPLAVDRWFHIAAVRTGNTNRIFLDGSLLGEQNAGSNADVGPGGEARIGAKVHMGAGRYFRGGVDEVSLYGRALSENEIYRLGTMKPQLSLRTVSGQVELAWTSQSNRTYEANYCSDLSANSWSNLGSSIVATSSMTIVHDTTPEAGTQRFYRVVTPVP